MGMNPTLAAMYDTHGAGQVQQEELAKIAHLELFAKAAMAQGIDLSALDDGTRNALYTEFTTKLAEEEDSEEEEEEGEEEEESEGDESKEAAARREYAAMAEWQEKNAQADFLGRRMAHAFWNEYNEISKEAGVADVARRGASAVGQGGRKLKSIAEQGGGKLKDLAGRGGKKLKDVSGASDAQEILHANRALKGAGGHPATRHVAEEARDAAVGSLKGKAAKGALGAGAVGGAFAAGRASKGESEKDASAFDHAAANQGLKIASASGWDADEAATRLTAVLTLGTPESEKVAYAKGNYDDALNIRGLELLESAGYPVDWTQVFG